MSQFTGFVEVTEVRAVTLEASDRETAIRRIPLGWGKLGKVQQRTVSVVELQEVVAKGGNDNAEREENETGSLPIDGATEQEGNKAPGGSKQHNK